MTSSDARDALGRMQFKAQQAELLRTLAGAREWVRTHEQEHPIDGPTAQSVALLEVITSEPGAKPGYQLIRAGVDAGTLTWEHFWHHASDYGTVGLELKLEVAHRLMQTIRFEELGKDAPGVPGRRRDDGTTGGAGHRGPPSQPPGRGG